MKKRVNPSDLTGRVGLFGGTFDPIHNGHLQIARAARDKFFLDSIVFVPAWKNPLKDEAPSLSGKDRAELIELAIRSEEKFFLSDFEIGKAESSYTIDTIREFKTNCHADLYFLLGSDSLSSFSKWKCYEEILSSVQLIVYERRGFSVDTSSLQAQNLISGEWIDVSSTFIRSELDAGRVPEELLPKEVAFEIRKKRLYGIR